MDPSRLSGKEYLILDMLRTGVERYGLEMVKSSEGSLKRGTVYVTLNRMVEKGYLKSRHEKDPTDPGMPRRLYIISGEGQRALQIEDAARAAAGVHAIGGFGYA